MHTDCSVLHLHNIIVTQRPAVSCLGNYELRRVFSSQTIKMAECDHSELLTSENEECVGKVKQFLEAGCRCSRGIKGSHCSLQFSEAAVLENLNNCMELSHGELDLVILANI